MTQNVLAKQGLTLLRLFATVRINSQDAALSAEGSFGFIMVDGDAFAVQAVPDPMEDPDAAWLYWEARSYLPASDAMQHRELDIKARRTFRGNDTTLAMILQNDDPAQSLEFFLSFRYLLGL